MIQQIEITLERGNGLPIETAIISPWSGLSVPGGMLFPSELRIIGELMDVLKRHKDNCQKTGEGT